MIRLQPTARLTSNLWRVHYAGAAGLYRTHWAEWARPTSFASSSLQQTATKTVAESWQTWRCRDEHPQRLCCRGSGRPRRGLSADTARGAEHLSVSLMQTSVFRDTRARPLHPVRRYVDSVDTLDLESAYAKLIGSRGYQWDMAQLDAVRVLQNVARGLMGWAPLSSIPESMKKQPPPKGAYLWSTLPGTGKSMLMELFYENVSIRQRRRTHFNAFMLEIHERLHALRTQPKIRESTTNSTTHSITQRLFGALLGHRQTRVGNRLDTEPNSVDVVASQIVESSWLLCLDEMQVTDIAEAMVLRRFYQTFRALGGVLVTTSNRAPAGLYENGLQRDLFLPFIEALQQNCYIHKLDGRVDYRLQTLLEENAASSALPLYIYPPTAANRQRFERLLQALAKSQENADSGASLALPYETMVIRTLGRNLLVERAIPGASIVRFRFPELCDRPLAAADYIALAERFQTFFLEDVPGCIRDRNLARRFITLIDILYDRRARLVCLAESPPEHLFQIVDEKSDEAFAAQRCISRIVDMQTKRYIQGNLGNAGEPNDLEVSSRPSVGAAS